MGRENPAREARHQSHLPVLDIIFKNTNVKSVFEYGSGLYSTRFFVDHAESVTTVEMNKIRWYQFAKDNLELPNAQILYLFKHEAVDYFVSNGKNYDLVFVDGDRELRKDCVQGAMNRAPIIVVHDIDLTWRRYIHRGWKDIIVPDNYRIITMQIDYPSTTVYTSDENLFNILKTCKSVVIK